MLSVNHLLQQLCWYPQNLEQAYYDFAHVHDIALHFDAKTVKYILIDFNSVFPVCGTWRSRGLLVA